MKSREPKHRKAIALAAYKSRDAKPEVRNWLLAVRLSKTEIKEYRAMCKAMGVKPAAQLRKMVNVFSGITSSRG